LNTYSFKVVSDSAKLWLTAFSVKKQEKTQGIDTETATKDRYTANKKQKRQNYLTLGRVTSNTSAFLLTPLALKKSPFLFYLKK
jgi:hypothetical protein